MFEHAMIMLKGLPAARGTVIRHGHRDPSIAALILDSPFASLEMVVRELIAAGRLRQGET